MMVDNLALQEGMKNTAKNECISEHRAPGSTPAIPALRRTQV